MTKRAGSFFVLCIVWGLLITDPTLETLHQNILKIAYPGFAISFVGILTGIIEAIIYGFVFGVLYVWLCKVCYVTK
jgi:hypothetical protein